jgi:predicted ATPase
MIRKITFGKKFRTIPAGLAIELKPGVNLLVGDNGSGKSTLLLGIEGQSHLLKEAAATVESDEGTRVKFWDFEKFNPRLSTAFGGTGLDDEVSMIFASHGQSVAMILRGFAQQAIGKPTTFLFDEPDMAMSIRTCRAMEKAFRGLAGQGHQVIAAVHNPILILGYSEVYSMEHHRWMKSSEFVDSQMA